MYHNITIERQYASGGNEIGKLLAQELGYRFYDRNILIKAAAELGIPPVYIENLEETGPGSIIFNLSQTALGGAASKKEESKLPLAQRLFLTEKRIVEQLVEEENCVIVGRAAGYILKERTDTLNVFIHADTAKRLERAVRREGVGEAEAEAVLKKNDRRRKGFYEYHTSRAWGSPESFDLCLDSGSLGISACVSILKTAATPASAR